MPVVRNMIGAEIGDDYIDMKITMKENYDAFIRTVQDAIMGFLEIPIDKIDNTHTLTSNEQLDELVLEKVSAAFGMMPRTKH